MSHDTRSNGRPTETDIRDRVLATADLPLERGQSLPKTCFTDAAWFGHEVDVVLKRQWLCAGHVSQVPRPGDFFNLDWFGEPMVVVRGKDDVVRVLSRACPHRGMDVNPTEYGRPAKGNARFLLCPYHFWSFDLDGRCKGTPEMQRAEGFSRRDVRLAQFPVEIWNGFIFTAFAEGLPPVAEQYAEMGRRYADWELDKWQVVFEQEWDGAFNWKVIVENFSESYHHLGAHVNTLEPMFPAKTVWTDDEQLMFQESRLLLRPALAAQVLAGESPVRALVDAPRLAIERKVQWYLFVGYPTFLTFAAPDRVYWYRVVPEGPGRTRLLTTLLVRPESKQLPDWDERLAREIELMRQFHLEDMEVCVAVQRGMNASRFAPGRLSHLEKPVWLFQRYLARMLRDAGEEAVARDVVVAQSVCAGAGCGTCD